MRSALNLSAFLVGGISAFAILTGWQDSPASTGGGSEPARTPITQRPSGGVPDGNPAQRKKPAMPDESRYLRMDPVSALSELATLRPTNDVQRIRNEILESLRAGNCSPDLVKDLCPLLPGEEYRPFLKNLFSSIDRDDPGNTAKLFSLFENEMSLPLSRVAILNGVNQSLHAAGTEGLRTFLQGIHSEFVQQNILRNYINSNDTNSLDPSGFISLTEEWNPRTRNGFIGDLGVKIMKSSPEDAISLAASTGDPGTLERVLVEGISVTNSANAGVSDAIQTTSEFTRFQVAGILAEKLIEGGKSADYLIESISQPIASAVRGQVQRKIGQMLSSRMDAAAFGSLLKRVNDPTTRDNLIHGQTQNGDADYSTAVNAILNRYPQGFGR